MSRTRIGFPSAIGSLLPDAPDHATLKWIPKVRSVSDLSGDPASLKLTAEDLEWVRKRLEAELRENKLRELDNHATIKISRSEIDLLRRAAEARPTDDSAVTQEVQLTAELRAHAKRRPVLEVSADPELSMTVPAVRPREPGLSLVPDPFQEREPVRSRSNLTLWRVALALIAGLGITLLLVTQPELRAQLGRAADDTQAWLLGVQEMLISKAQSGPPRP